MSRIYVAYDERALQDVSKASVIEVGGSLEQVKGKGRVVYSYNRTGKFDEETGIELVNDEKLEYDGK